MRRAQEVFTFEQRSSSSPVVEQVWQTSSEPEDFFISAAASHWEMVVTRQGPKAKMTVRGPETSATAATIPQDAEFLGMVFSLGTFMPRLPLRHLVDRSLTLTPATGASFWLDGSRFPIPGADDADAFVGRLVAAGLLEHDPIVPAAVAGHVPGLSARSLQRRVSRATGLTRAGIRQIRRAGDAAELLTRGVSPLDAAHRLGYSDQPHLIRSLRRFVGKTPGEIVAASGGG